MYEILWMVVLAVVIVLALVGYLVVMNKRTKRMRLNSPEKYMGAEKIERFRFYIFIPLMIVQFHLIMHILLLPM